MTQDKFLTRLGEFETDLSGFIFGHQDRGSGPELNRLDVPLYKVTIKTLSDLITDSYNHLLPDAVKIDFIKRGAPEVEKPSREFLDDVLGVIRGIRKQIKNEPNIWINNFEDLKTSISPSKIPVKLTSPIRWLGTIPELATVLHHLKARGWLDDNFYAVAAPHFVDKSGKPLGRDRLKGDRGHLGAKSTAHIEAFLRAIDKDILPPSSVG